MKRESLVGACLSAALFAACSGNNGLSPSARSVAPLFAAQPSKAVGSAALPATGANLYVANYGSSTVTIYASGKNKVLRTISQGVGGPGYGRV